MKKIYGIRLLSLFLCSALSMGAQAAVKEEPGFNWKLDGELQHEDNVYRTLDRFSQSDTLFVLHPTLHWLGLKGKHRFDFGYEGEYAWYRDVSDLNYNDHHLKGRARLEHSYRLASELVLGYDRSHDVPGSTDALSLPIGEPDKWWEGYGSFQLSYGRNDSKGQLVGRIEYHKRRYTNNFQEYRDYRLTRGVGIFYYRIAPKTRMLFEVDLDDSHYPNDDLFGLNQTNFEYRLLSGVTWEATAKTSGTFKIGYRDRNYDDSRMSDLNGLALELDAVWKPNTYTKVTLSASQNNQNAARQGANGYVRRYLRGGIDHAITPRTLLTAHALYGNDKFEGAVNREDDRWFARIGVVHSLRRWLYARAEYRYEERDSNISLYDYKTNIFLIGLEGRFH